MDKIKTDLTASASESTLSVCSIGGFDESSASTIPYINEGGNSTWSDGESDLLSDADESRDLWTHHYVADREPAPYAESNVDEIVADSSHEDVETTSERSSNPSVRTETLMQSRK